jgi:tRNA (guanosine-2'-O-)-methyltransferase
VNPDVALGSDKWLTMTRYNKSDENTNHTYNRLRENGYRIVATTPHEKGDVELDDFSLSAGKVALVFGTELKGLSNVAIDNADEYLKIPMYGFTESFNISVSAAIILHHLTAKLRNGPISWQLSDKEKDETMLAWLRNSINKSELIEKKFLSSK